MTTLFSLSDTTEFDFAQCHDSGMIFGAEGLSKDFETDWVENNPCCFC